MEDEGGGGRTGEEGHVSLGGEEPASKAEALSLCGDFCDGNSKDFPAFP